MPAHPRILLSEGSSLSARETITVLGLMGHRVELMSSDPGCLGRFSRFVQRVHRAPASGLDPDGYLTAMLEVVARRRIDVLIPVHEQAYVLAARRSHLPVHLATALADFAAFEAVQSKGALSALLSGLGAPQPATELVRSLGEFIAERPYPFFVKTAFGTASTGVWRVSDRRDRDALGRQLEERGAFGQGLVVQAAAAGPLERIQAVFDQGRLVASHIYRQIIAGPHGGDILKAGVECPKARAWVDRIGKALRWHGALSFDYIIEQATGRPLFIDANPRLVEPMNAWLSGINLPGALLAISLNQTPPSQPEARPGVVTALGLMGLLEAARRRDLRRDVLDEIRQLVRRTGRYRGALEELTPIGIDPCCLVPLVVVAATLLLYPRSARWFSEATVRNYSLTPDAVRRLAVSISNAEPADRSPRPRG